jgi:hypothetical protein
MTVTVLLLQASESPVPTDGFFDAVFAAGLEAPSSATRPSGEAASGAGVQPATGDRGLHTSGCCSMSGNRVEAQDVRLTISFALLNSAMAG